MHLRLAASFMTIVLASTLLAFPGELPDGTKAATQQIATFRHPSELTIELFAAEPKLASPVAIAVDERNRVFVAEEYRFNQGTEENRTRPFFLEDDLQIRTLDDRLAMYRKWSHKFPDGMKWFNKHSDQIRLLEDTRGTGKADRSTIFAGGFNGTLDGLAAGVMASNGKVYFTCIPNLWMLQDRDGDGIADERKPLLTGFGVNCAFLGHDLHGLCWGPDGRLYFSIGDRGYHVATKEGTTLASARNGAVFRCEADGSQLEVVHRGLRNPQELAFDQFGNLFADDNNCDKGDHSRLVYVVEEGESGWNMAYQTIPDPYLAGPWFAERLWHLHHPGQAAYIVPPVGKLGAGPSGFLFTSGTSLPERYRNSFLMCNYTGSGGLEAFRVRSVGAGFEIQDYHDFLKPIRATDCEFGYDGKLYISDFVDLKWDGGSAGGRIYTLFDRQKLDAPVVKQTKALFAEGFQNRSEGELSTLLHHPDQRVRLRAQFTLVEKGESAAKTLNRIAAHAPDPLARLHAIWGLGQLLRKKCNVAAMLTPLLLDPDAEVRAQTAKVLGEAKERSAEASILKLLADPEARVRFFAAQALGQIASAQAVSPLFQLLQETGDRDPYLRHAAVIALTRIGAKDAVLARSQDSSAPVRMAVVLVLRRWKDVHLADFLNDRDEWVRSEAARAIHDLPLEDLLPQLAKLLPGLSEHPPVDSDALIRRVIHANYRLGQAEHARAVLNVVTDSRYSSAIRHEALLSLRDWSEPTPRDRVTGFWRPLPKRDPAIVREVVSAGMNDLLEKTSGSLQADAVALLGRLDVAAEETTFARWARDSSKSANLRIASLRFLADRKSTRLTAAVQGALNDSDALVRAVGRDLLAASSPADGLKLLSAVLQDSNAVTLERQQAFATVARLKSREAGAILDQWAERLVAGKVPPELVIELLDALKAFPDKARDARRLQFESKLPTDPIGKFRLSLVGGNADRGKDLFFNHTAAQCIRCHRVDTSSSATSSSGGIAGPDLSGVASRHPEKTREYLLESLVLPSAQIAPGFGTTTLTLSDGKVLGGTIVSEDRTTVTLLTPAGIQKSIAKDDIESRTMPVSPMPSVERTLTPREMRDLIEYLTTLKSPSK